LHGDIIVYRGEGGNNKINMVMKLIDLFENKVTNPLRIRLGANVVEVTDISNSITKAQLVHLIKISGFNDVGTDGIGRIIIHFPEPSDLYTHIDFSDRWYDYNADLWWTWKQVVQSINQDIKDFGDSDDFKDDR